MLRRAFDLVIALQPSSGGRGALVDLARAEAFFEDARIKYPEHPVTYYMQGQLQIIKDDPVGAIQALTQAYDKAAPWAQPPSSQARYWLGYLRVNRLPSEQLALLYMNRSQAGEAQRYAEAAVSEFTEVGVTPPPALVCAEAELLRQVAKAEPDKEKVDKKLQEALALLDQYAQTYPDDQNLRGAGFGAERPGPFGGSQEAHSADARYRRRFEALAGAEGHGAGGLRGGREHFARGPGRRQRHR